MELRESSIGRLRSEFPLQLSATMILFYNSEDKYHELLHRNRKLPLYSF